MRNLLFDIACCNKATFEIRARAAEPTANQRRTLTPYWDVPLGWTRDVAATQLLQLRAQLRRIRAEIAAPLRRTDQPPTNDLRRAVRPEEIFLVTTFINGRHLCNQVLAKLRGALQ